MNLILKTAEKDELEIELRRGAEALICLNFQLLLRRTLGFRDLIKELDCSQSCWLFPNNYIHNENQWESTRHP